MASTPKLDFAVVANNTIPLEITVVDQDGNSVNGTGMSIKWQWFLPGGTITKTTAGGSIIVTTVNPLVIAINLLDTDTDGVPEGYYPHEAVTVDASGNPVTITNNDPILSWGTGFLRRQLTVQ